MRLVARRALPLLLALLLTAMSAAPGRAQPGVCPYGVGCERPDRASQALVLAGNGVVGGVSAGVTSMLRGEPFWPAFQGGVLGGIVTFAGKRLAVEHFSGAGLAGRQVAAVGSSMTRNAAAGNRIFSELMFPLGPGRLYLRPERADVHFRLDLYSSAVLAHAFIARDVELDVGRSLSSGAFVFWEDGAHSDARWLARERAGVVRLNRDRWALHADRHGEIEAHERVHVVQHDQIHLLIGEPLQRLAADRLPLVGRLTRWVDLGLEAALWAGANSAIPYEQRPWEREAAALTRVEGAERGGVIAIPDMRTGPGDASR